MNRLDKIIVTLCAIGFLLCCAGIARGANLYPASVTTFAAAQVLDVHSAWRKYEANPLLRSPDGRFGVRGVTIKSGIAAGNLTVQTLILRKWPKARKAAAVIYFAAAGMIVGVAARNYRQ